MFKLIILLALGGVRLCCLEPYKASSASMEPSLPQGRILVVDKTAFGSNRCPRRGDIVVFDYPESSMDALVKRVIGLPGDTIEMRDHVLYVNNLPLPGIENCRRGACTRLETLDGVVYPITYRSKDWINPGGRWRSDEGYFVMGDNRSNSYDSRYFGAIAASDLRGRVVFQMDENTLFSLTQALNALLH